MCEDYALARWHSKNGLRSYGLYSYGLHSHGLALARWHSKNGDHATIEFTWKLSDYQPGSSFTRFANPVGTKANPQIGGTLKELTGAKGSVTAQVGWYQMVPGYPEAFFYALQVI